VTNVAVQPLLVPEQFELIAESIPHIVWVARADGSTEHFNRQGAEYTGRPREPNDGWDWVLLLHPDDADQARRRWENSIRTRTRFECDCRIRRADGEYRWHALRASPLRSDSEVAKWIVTATDIEQSRRSDAELHCALADAAQTLSTVRKEAEQAQRDLTHAAVDAIALMVEARDPYTGGHQQRVGGIAAAIANRLGLDSFTVEGIKLAATIHDIGKVAVPAEILTRPGKLTPPEWEMLTTHPQVGHDIIDPINFPWPIADMILQHHERLDGSGYPSGLSGESISLGARIIAVADVVEAMSSHRPYRPGLGLDVALAELKRGRATEFDPHIVDVCLTLCQDGHLPP
jgi:PAS domain S-box-containing protein